MYVGNTLFVIRTVFRFNCDPDAPHVARKQAGFPEI